METHRKSEDEARHAIEEAETEDVVLNKFGFWIENNLPHVGGDILGIEFAGTNRGIEIDFF